MDTLIGRKLVKVERLGWHQAGELDDPSVGPIHLVFEGCHGIFFSGASDWSLEVVETAPGSTGWLDAYDYVWDGSRWSLRDASVEAPFAAVIGEPLAGGESIRNEVDEVIGLHLTFGGKVLTLKTWEGEVKT
ncbi:hypothetical protein ACQP2X_39115 [Actinoplanes sp. CA-131856]